MPDPTLESLSDDSFVSHLPNLRSHAERLTTDPVWYRAGVDTLSVFLQLALHVPRFEWAGALRSETILEEGRRLRERLATVRKPILDMIPFRMSQAIELTGTPLIQVGSDVARQIHECFHYLMSYRRNSFHFGLTIPGDHWPFVLVSLSPFDLFNVFRADSVRGGATLVVSRVYAFPGAPRNSISYLLARCRQWLRENQPGVTHLVTYCNPNLGFTGASYVADNWQLLGYERQTRYAYLHGNYVTDRRLAEAGRGTIQTQGSEQVVPGIEFSKWPLKPLQLYIRDVGSGSASVPHELGQFDRWIPKPGLDPPDV